MVNLSKYKIEILLALALMCAIFSRLHTWDNSHAVVGTYQMQPYYLQDFIYFISTDLALFFTLTALAVATKKDLAWALVILSIGKILDEFTSPFSFGVAEACVDAMAILFIIYQWIKKSN